MAVLKRSLPVEAAHPLFQGVFSDWQTKAGVLSALPDAPVVADDSRTGRPLWRHRPRPGRGSRRWSRLAGLTRIRVTPSRSPTPSR